MAETSFTVHFAKDDGGVGPLDPDDPPCPEGFTGPIPAPVLPPDGIIIGPTPPPPEPTTTEPKLAISIASMGKGLSTGSSNSDKLPDNQRRVELTVHFQSSDDDCHRWSTALCWRPVPMDFLNLLVNDVAYRGTYNHDEALPTLTGVYDAENNTIVIDESEGDEKQHMKVMWPPGNLFRHLRFDTSGNTWYEPLLKWRLRADPPPENEWPEFWITGPTLLGDDFDIVGSYKYAYSVPVVFTLTAGLLGPADVDAFGTVYEEFTTHEAAFKPSSPQNGVILAAQPPEDGEEYDGPGTEFNEEGLNRWIAEQGPPEGVEYTLLMEVWPAYGRYQIGCDYACGKEGEEEVYSLQGNYGFSYAPSSFRRYPKIKVPVAYLKLGGGLTYIFIYVRYFTIPWDDPEFDPEHDYISENIYFNGEEIDSIGWVSINHDGDTIPVGISFSYGAPLAPDVQEEIRDLIRSNCRFYSATGTEPPNIYDANQSQKNGGNKVEAKIHATFLEDPGDFFCYRALLSYTPLEGIQYASYSFAGWSRGDGYDWENTFFLPSINEGEDEEDEE